MRLVRIKLDDLQTGKRSVRQRLFQGAAMPRKRDCPHDGLIGEEFRFQTVAGRIDNLDLSVFGQKAAYSILHALIDDEHGCDRLCYNDVA